MNDNKFDIIPEQFNCPRCGSILFEKIPNDKYVLKNKLNTIRLSCTCGYYRDEIIDDLTMEE